MKKILNKKSWLLAVAAAFVVATVGAVPAAMAEDEQMYGFSMSPMDQQIVLMPGDSYESSLNVTNPGTHTTELDYEVNVEPFYRDDDATAIFENIGGRGEMANWITITSHQTGHLMPNETDEVTFRIDVPEDAPAGGQYASVIVSSSSSSSADAMIKETRRIGHLIYAEISGETVRSGEIMNLNVPAFLLSGNIAGSASIKNTGNTHGVATYKLQVFPLFSDEEVYTNEENPETHLILPDQTYYAETAWEKTPEIGIYNVVYTVEFAGKTAQASKLVIKCPIWLLFIVLFVVAGIAIWLATRVWGRKSKRRA